MSKTSNACPSFFRAHVKQAAANYRGGYAGAGYQLAVHAADLATDDVDAAHVHELRRLARLPGSAATDAVGAWLLATFPRCAELVPRRRVATFLAGVGRAVDEERVG